MPPETHTQQFQKLPKKQLEEEYQDTQAFLRACAAGTFAGGLPHALALLPSAVEIANHSATVAEMVWAVVPVALPLLLAAFISLVALGTFGMQATKFLKSRNRETMKNYLFLGSIGGAAFALLFAVAAGGLSAAISPAAGLFIGGPGLLAGLATAFVWGRHRVRLRELREASEATQSPNPIHDLIY